MLLIVLSTTIGNSQVTNYFKEGSRWVYSSWESSEPGQQTVHRSEEQFIIHGDTVISGVPYAKLYSTVHHMLDVFHSWPPHTETIHTYDSIGPSFIRYDTLINKVFYLPSIDSTERLIYDFNLQVGDTTPLQSINLETTVVRSIDTVSVFGISVRRFFITDVSQNMPESLNYILEGIGGSNGLISSTPETYPLGGGVYTTLLSCFQNQDSTYLVFDIDCPFIDFISDIKQISDKHVVTIYPNPTHDIVIMNISDDLLHGTYTLFDCTGRVTQSFKLTEINTLIRLDTAGLYFWEVKDKNNLIQTGIIISQ